MKFNNIAIQRNGILLKGIALYFNRWTGNIIINDNVALKKENNQALGIGYNKMFNKKTDKNYMYMGHDHYWMDWEDGGRNDITLRHTTFDPTTEIARIRYPVNTDFKKIIIDARVRR